MLPTDCVQSCDPVGTHPDLASVLDLEESTRLLGGDFAQGLTAVERRRWAVANDLSQVHAEL